MAQHETDMAQHPTDMAQHETEHVPTHARVLVVGGGNGGISLAARLNRQGVDDVVIVEPRVEHQYRPLLSYVGAGLASIEAARRPQREAMPSGSTWVRDAVERIDPHASTVALRSGATIGYDQLVLAAGSRPDWAAIDGSAEVMLAENASTNYLFDLAPKTWRLIDGMRAGTALFTMPDATCPCAGAAQKVLYMACDLWRSRGVLDDIRVVLTVPTDTVFGVPGVDEELMRKVAEYGIELRTNTTVRALDRETNTATLEADGRTEDLPYDLLHLTPPHAAPAWVKQSGLSSEQAAGFGRRRPRHAATPPLPERLGDRRHRGHAGVELRRGAAQGDARRGEEPAGGARREGTAAAVPRLHRQPVHRQPAHHGVRRVRSGRDADAEF
ncbi:NAD(P)/FAD-dependent oxidoreductase [Tersicoccus phoenicis]|uniref:NAD(P)/FAD-dependent oxidoreductase n=1 Tax=Tersicoccus phoenicis TaxID=554083 RepID=UPI002E25BA38